LINTLTVLRATLQAAAAMGMGGEAFTGAAETVGEIMAKAEGELSALSARVAELEAERDEARALKVPVSTEALLLAQMDAAVLRARVAELDAELTRLRKLVEKP
jgi:BMFP domain-containing protein YqiC